MFYRLRIATILLLHVGTVFVHGMDSSKNNEQIQPKLALSQCITQGDLKQDEKAATMRKIVRDSIDYRIESSQIAVSKKEQRSWGYLSQEEIEARDFVLHGMNSSENEQNDSKQVQREDKIIDYSESSEELLANKEQCEFEAKLKAKMSISVKAHQDFLLRCDDKLMKDLVRKLKKFEVAKSLIADNITYQDKIWRWVANELVSLSDTNQMSYEFIMRKHVEVKAQVNRCLQKKANPLESVAMSLKENQNSVRTRMEDISKLVNIIKMHKHEYAELGRESYFIKEAFFQYKWSKDDDRIFKSEYEPYQAKLKNYTSTSSLTQQDHQLNSHVIVNDQSTLSELAQFTNLLRVDQNERKVEREKIQTRLNDLTKDLNNKHTCENEIQQENEIKILTSRLNLLARDLKVLEKDIPMLENNLICESVKKVIFSVGLHLEGHKAP